MKGIRKQMEESNNGNYYTGFSIEELRDTLLELSKNHYPDNNREFIVYKPFTDIETGIIFLGKISSQELLNLKEGNSPNKLGPIIYYKGRGFFWIRLGKFGFSIKKGEPQRLVDPFKLFGYNIVFINYRKYE